MGTTTLRRMSDQRVDINLNVALFIKQHTRYISNLLFSFTEPRCGTNQGRAVTMFCNGSRDRSARSRSRLLAFIDPLNPALRFTKLRGERGCASSRPLRPQPRTIALLYSFGGKLFSRTSIASFALGSIVMFLFRIPTALNY